MKEYNIEITKEFIYKINEISDYIYRFYFNKEASIKFYNDIYQKFSL